MTNSRLFILLIFLITFGCGNEKVNEKRISVDVTKPYKLSFIGMYGDKVHTKINGKFSGSIKVAMVGSSNKLTEGNFSVFKDSINLDIGMFNIYQDRTGFIWHVKPDKTTGGKILISMTEYIK